MSNVYRDCEFCDAPAEMNTARCADHELLPDDARWCVSCEDWRYGRGLIINSMATDACIACWSPTMSRAEKNRIDDEAYGRQPDPDFFKKLWSRTPTPTKKKSPIPTTPKRQFNFEEE